MRASDVNGGPLSVTLVHVKLDALSLCQGAEAFGVDGRLVHEHVSMTITGSDETETFLRIEPLDGTCIEKSKDKHTGGSTYVCGKRSRQEKEKEMLDTACKVTYGAQIVFHISK